MFNTFRFAIALSFPGEHRTRVEEIASILAERLDKERILYDRWFEAEFARPNLDVYLPKLYHTQSELLVFFLCKTYNEKEWCGLEWRVGRELLKKGEDDRIMFLRLDDAETVGLYSIDGYLDIRDLSARNVAEQILRRFERLAQVPSTPPVDELFRNLRSRILPAIESRCGKLRILTMEQPIEIGGI